MPNENHKSSLAMHKAGHWQTKMKLLMSLKLCYCGQHLKFSLILYPLQIRINTVSVHIRRNLLVQLYYGVGIILSYFISIVLT